MLPYHNPATYLRVFFYQASGTGPHAGLQKANDQATMTKKPSESPFSKRFQREQKHSAILSEAARLFNIHGARATRLSDIAARLDLNKTSLYYYVKSKDDLIYQTYLASCAAIGSMLDQADAQGANGAEKLASFIRLYFAAWREIGADERPHFAILSEIRALRAGHRQRVASRYSAMYGRIKAFIREGIEDSSLKPCNATDSALALFGVVQLIILWLPEIEPADFDQAAEDFIDIVFNGITLDPSMAMKASPGRRTARQGVQLDRPAPSLQEAFCRVGSANFNRKGFKATSLDDIAAELAVTKGAFYYYVKDKDDLLFQCFRRSLTLMTTTQERAVAGGGSGLHVLRRAVLDLFTLQTGPAGPLIRFNLIPSLSSQYRRNILSDLDLVSARFGNMIETGIGEGSIRPVNPFVAEQMLMSAIDLSAELPWMREIGDVSEACESYFSFYFGGLSSTSN